LTPNSDQVELALEPEEQREVVACVMVTVSVKLVPWHVLDGLEDDKIFLPRKFSKRFQNSIQSF
jgi:hypothetical protein